MTIAAAYIPVIHKGHQEFCRKVRPDILYVLGKSFLREIKLLERDIRALDPEEIVIACRALSLAGSVKLLEKKDINNLINADKIVFADDEAMHYVADKYLSKTKILFEKIFLRWDKMAAVTINPISPNITISKKEFDRKFIKKARDNSKKSSDWWRQVGAVIVKKGKIILEGHNQHKPTENAPYIDGDPRANFNAGEHPEIYTALHGEAGLIAKAAEKGISLKDASIYVTTFLCPNCAMMIIQAGIKKVYYADGYSNLSAQENLKIAGVKIVRVK